MARKFFVGGGALNLALYSSCHVQLFLCLALFSHSQRPGEVAVWLDHLEVVSILSWPGFESSSLRVFPSKQQHLMA